MPKSIFKASFIKLLNGADLSFRQLAYLEIKSPKVGPVVWLVAGLHGDEVGGVAAVGGVFKKLNQVGLVKGKVCAFPLVNPRGFKAGIRQLPASFEDINRAFPGKAKGTLAQKLAVEIFGRIKESKPAAVIDLHNDWQDSVGYVLIDNHQGKAWNSAKKYAQQFGLPVVLEEKSKDQDKTLSGSLIKGRIPALVIETSGTGTVDRPELKEEIKAIFNFLSFLGMVKTKRQTAKSRILRYSEKPVSRTSGSIRFLIRPGDIVKANQPVAVVCGKHGKAKETLKSPAKSLVLGYYSDSAVARVGQPVLAFGVMK